MKKLLNSLPFRLLAGVIIGILVGLVANETFMNIVVTAKQLLGELITFCVPLIVIGFIAAIVVPVFMVLWGVRLRKNPPAYLQGRLSFRTKRAKRDAELWNYANTFFSHMILVAGVNGGLVSAVFYIGSMILTGGAYWAAAAVSLLCVQAACVLFLYRITDFLVKKMYRSPEDEMEDSAEELKTLRYPDCNEKDIGKK